MDAGRGGEPAAKRRAVGAAVFPDRFAARCAALADYLDDAVAQSQCKRIHLVASSPMLGALRSSLSPATLKLLGATVGRDLTIYQGRGLSERVDAALKEHG